MTPVTCEVGPEHEGLRLDKFLAGELPNHSRAQVQRLIDDGRVSLPRVPSPKANTGVRTGDTVTVDVPAPSPTALEPEDLPLPILFDDADVVVVNKPAGLIVHRGWAQDRVVMLDNASWGTLIRGAADTFLHRGERVIRVIGPSPQEEGTTVDIILADGELWTAMVDYSWRLAKFAILLSLLVGSVLFLALQVLIVQPLRQITRELAQFRDRPEDATADGPTMERADEIGVVERALAEMRHSLRRALSEKTRLAGLGAGMSRISHDLRNILATAVLISDRLERSEDPAVRKVGTRLVETLDRASRLCSETLTYARTGPPRPQLRRVNLLALIEQVRAGGSPVNEYKVDLGTPRIGGDRQVDLHVAPLPEKPGHIVVMLQERTIADKMDRQLTHRVLAVAPALSNTSGRPPSGGRSSRSRGPLLRGWSSAPGRWPRTPWPVR